MSDDPEWKDANPKIENMPNKGKNAILFIAGGLALIVLTIAGIRIRPLGLMVGGFTFISGLMMLVRRRQFFYKPGLIVSVCGFFLLLANPRFGVVAGFAAYFLIIGAVGLAAFGLFQAIKLAWDIWRLS
ncbi:MAG: hypothetical protein FWB83_02325 [Treponema sp.]|nr:hypothetical protein [Treponema sp.]